MKAPEPMECSAKAPKCACYKALEKNAEYDEEDMVYCNHCSDIVGNEKEVYGDETVEYKMANGELVCIPCYKIWMKEYKNDLDPHYSPFYAETFSAEEICKTYVCYTEMGGVGKDSDAKRGKKLLILMGATNIRIKNNPTKHEGQIISSDIPDDWMGMVRITFDYCTVKSKNTRSNVQNKIEWIADKRNPIHMNKRWAWNNNPKNDDDWIFADLDYLARTLEEKKDSHSAETFASDWWSMGRGNFQNSYDQAEAIEAIEECVRADGRGDMRLHEAMGAIQTIVNRTYGIGEPVGGENVRFEDFGAETFEADKDYEWEWDRIDIAPTELIKKRLKEAGFKLVDSAKSYGVISGYYEPKLVAKNGNLLDVTLSQNDEFDGFSRLTFYDDNDENTTGYFEIDWDILYEKGLLKGEDSVENPQGDYYQVYWDGLYDEWKDSQKESHNCSDNADLEIYGDDFIVMECNICGRNATFRQETPFYGPRNAETFEAAVIRQGKAPKGAMAKAMMNQSMMEQANIEAMIQELENKVNLGLISEDDLMASLKKKFGAEYDIEVYSSEEFSKEDLEAYFADLKKDNPKLAKIIEFKVKNEEYLPKQLIESSGYDYEILEAWNDYVIDDDKYALFDPCPACEGEGWIMTSYTPATRFEPADGDGEDCGECGGSGKIDPSDYMYYDDKGEIEYAAETKISKICPNCEQKGKSKKDATTDYICDFCAQCKRCCETSYGCYDVAICNDCDGSFIGKDIDGCCGSCDNCCECGDY